MTCHQLTEVLSDYLSGELPRTQRIVLERHLAECPDCRRYLDSFRKAVAIGKAALAETELPPMPDQLVDAILKACGHNPT